MTLLEERGLFWWHDEPIPDRHFAPDSAVPGLLKIENDGETTLELDRFMPNEKGPLAALVQSFEILDRCIQGILKDSSRRVLLVGLVKNGSRFSSNAMSYEKYTVLNCLVGERPFPITKKPLTFGSLEVALNGFEEWLRLGAIQIKRGVSRTKIDYKKPQDAAYLFDGGKIVIRYHLDGPHPGTHRSDAVSLKEVAAITYRPSKRSTLENLRSIYGLLEDLFILLTDANYCLEWPSVFLSKEARYRWYFMRVGSRDIASAPKYYECWTNFLQLRDTFGIIWSNWRRKREEFGAGFYLYLGTRRGIKLYTEHRFVNLIWGIEAFHRKRNTASESTPLSAKMRRIIDQVKAKKDKKWLENRLRYAGEPALEDRIFHAFKALPIGLDRDRLRAFSKSCADYRNDISHFGGPRPGTGYADFLKELDKKSDALSTLYHALLLQEIGVDDSILKWWIYEGYRSGPIKQNFVEVGLIDPDTLNDRANPPAAATKGK